MKITDKNGAELAELDLGIVDVNTTKEYSFVLVNNSDAELVGIELKVSHPEVGVITAPTALAPNTQADFIIKWSPTLLLKQGLKTTVNVTATELWR